MKRTGIVLLSVALVFWAGKAFAPAHIYDPDDFDVYKYSEPEGNRIRQVVF